jgi:hypothetical protein
MQTSGRRSSAALISAVVVLLTVSTLRGQTRVTATAQLSDAEYEVLSAYIAGTFTGSKGESRVGKGITRIVIINVTQSDPPLDANGHPMQWKQIAKLLRKEAPALDPTTLEAFRKMNTEQAALRRSFQLGIDYDLVDAGQIDAIFKNGGWWPEYYRAFPGSQGELTLSRVGFSGDGKQALLYASNSCGGKCGSGDYVLMQKREGRWVIAKEIIMWVS